ncbi:MAG TPA: SAM-dependent methyltransferase [Candidatus Acidoferrum sp.]|nr:SAM-dependent methyltransferase [Candidatus Acidoferrum sp.]
MSETQSKQAPGAMPSGVQEEPLIRNVSDTARWVAVYRAQETERPDAHFRDPFARRLAGDRGEQIAKSMPLGRDNSWSMVTRTCIGDDFINEQIAQGVDMVINLAAGLDARPYRMNLPATLKWVEVDLPEILAYKEEILRDEKPVCSLERIRVDLSNETARRALFAELGARCKKALVITEGLLIYLTPESAGGLARDLSAPASFDAWVLDLASPGLLKMLVKRMAKQLHQAAPFKFAPREGPEFFIPFGWKPADVRSLLKNAARLKRLSWFLRIIALFPETAKSRRDRPWSGVCLMRKA